MALQLAMDVRGIPRTVSASDDSTQHDKALPGGKREILITRRSMCPS